MDLVEKIHNILIEANLPSSINDLKNPTKEYIINLITTFLTWFKIDVNLIEKPTTDQQIVTSFEDSDIIRIINLHAVMMQICDRIFIKDFSVTDITNPGSKRTKNQAKFLANFILYATNKESDIEDNIKEIYSKGKLLEELYKSKNDRLEINNEKAQNISKKLALKQKYEEDIQKMQLLIETHEEKRLELQEEMKITEEKRERVMESYSSNKAELIKLTKEITELKAEIVHSPEEYKTRLNELEQQNRQKIEEREKVQETFTAKKHLLEQYEKLLSDIEKQHEKFPEVIEVYERLQDINCQEENIKRQLDMIKNSIDVESEQQLAMNDDMHRYSKVDEFSAQSEEQISVMRDLYSQLLHDKKLAAVKLEEEKTYYNEKCMEKEKLQGLIKTINGEISKFLCNCQNLYDSEIISEVNLWNTFMDNYKE